MSANLNEIEVRVLGCLVEKELATPEYYPLTVNALVNACNQKSNRDPVMTLEETAVLEALDSLRFKQLAHRSAEGVRAAKYCHNLDGLFRLEPQELAILAELLLRGPQTLGELRNRAERMAPFADLAEVERVVTDLLERAEPLLVGLPRQPGRKEPRYAHLFAPLPEGDTEPALYTPASPTADRLAVLESRIEELQSEFAALRQRFEDFSRQFE
ncbi:MAG: YceH family protein [Desulfuromonadales bacterium]|nr:YceH family protein [Desulfuromonadales bacterium]